MDVWVLVVALIAASGERQEITLTGYESREECFRAGVRITGAVMASSPWVSETKTGCRQASQLEG
jgi:hypothetical protein